MSGTGYDSGGFFSSKKQPKRTHLCMYVAARLPTNGWQVIDTSRPKTDEGRRRYQK